MLADKLFIKESSFKGFSGNKDHKGITLGNRLKRNTPSLSDSSQTPSQTNLSASSIPQSSEKDINKAKDGKPKFNG